MIKDNLLKLKERIYAVCSHAGVDPAAITIVAVAKNRTIEEIEEVVRAGILDIGENKVQEALLKFNEIMVRQAHHSSNHPEQSRGTSRRNNASTIKWHMVGHLQTNKVKEAVKIFDLIHSVDSLYLAQEIDKQAAIINKIQGILLQVKTSHEATKFGVKPEEAVELIKEIAKLKNVKIQGLMTIGAVVDNPEKARPYFKTLRELQAKIYELRVTNYELRILSMGMTDDFEAAVEEGSNMVRLGRVIFEGVIT